MGLVDENVWRENILFKGLMQIKQSDCLTGLRAFEWKSLVKLDGVIHLLFEESLD